MSDNEPLFKTQIFYLWKRVIFGSIVLIQLVTKFATFQETTFNNLGYIHAKFHLKRMDAMEVMRSSLEEAFDFVFKNYYKLVEIA